MKKILYSAVVLLCLSISFTACKKQLEPEFFSQLTANNFPASQKDVNSILTGFYANFRHDWNGLYCAITRTSWRYMSIIVTDEVKDNWNGDGMGSQFNWGANGYGGLFSLAPVVARTTGFLESLKTAPLSEDLKKSAVAETKCLRAWMMFLMYDFYGPVNVRLDASKLADTSYTARPTKQEYLGWMIKDLTEAMPDLLTRTNGTPSWGKVSKGLASMLLMKIYMNEKQWAQAKTVAESIMGMGYTLLPVYKNVFIQEGNNEVVWASPSGVNVPSRHIPCSTPWDIAAMLGQKVDQGWGGQFIPWDFYDKYPAQDTRLETIASEYLSVDGTVKKRNSANIGELRHGAIAFKNVVPYEKNRVGDFQTVGFRYADVLLSLAEIENEISGPTPAAVAYAKQVTDRAGIDIPNSARASKDAFRLYLSDERGRELYWEGWRRQDMIRMGTWIPWGLSKGFSAQPKHVLFPIPPSIINESRGKIAQNPGY
jgi:hypothetical protein